MSCYESEYGLITLPKSKFGAIHKEFVKAVNTIKERQLLACNTLRLHVLKIGAGKRGFDYTECMEDNAAKFRVPYGLVNKVTDNNKPRVLTRKAMEFANSKTMRFEIDDDCARISFKKEMNSVYWSVDENNHAIRSAHNDPVAKAFFEILHNVKWTKNSGGTIFANDEYRYDAGLGEYVAFEFNKS